MPVHWQFEAIGTHWTISHSGGLGKAVRTAVLDRIERFDATYSRFRTDSFVWRIGQNPGVYELPVDALPLLNFYRTLYDISAGKVTPFIGKTMEQAGYDKDYSLVVGSLTPPPTWEQAMSIKGSVLHIKQPGVLLDVGAAGKGYLVDIVADILRDNGIDDFVINAGGDIWVENGPATIGLEDPLDQTRALGQVDVTHQAIAASSPSRRRWHNFHHIIDPITLKPERRVSATWVIADSCMTADGLATALSFAHADILHKHFMFEYAMIESGNLRMSTNFNAQLFTANA